MIPIAKYTTAARFYDVVSAEYPVYAAGRTLGIEMLGLAPGSQVLDLGCGTGLNFSQLQRIIGPRGRIIGVDRSPDMLAQARRRAERHSWANVVLLEADATTLVPHEVADQITSSGAAPHSDAALATYTLSLMADWESAWANMLHLVKPGAVMGVVDMQKPSGLFTAMTPLARAACWLGGSDIDAHPWTAVERDCFEVRAAAARGEHLQIRVGNRPGSRLQPPR